MPTNLEDGINEIMIIKGYLAFSIDDPKEVTVLLKERHGIERGVDNIREKIRNIKDGKYDMNYFDNLLDVHFPDMYRVILQNMQSDLIDLDEMARNCDNESVRLNARKAHAALSIDLLNAMHKGPVLRAAKQLATKTKVMARQLIQAEAVLRDRTTKNQIETNRGLYPKLITLDSDLNEVKEGVEATVDELSRAESSNSTQGNR